MAGLALLGTRRKHVNVLQHLLGYPKQDLSPNDRQELRALSEDYRPRWHRCDCIDKNRASAV